jgi:hypothetical protein
MLRIISERTLVIDEELCACFIDWKKAFDRVNWTNVMQILKGIGIDWRERILISKLYIIVFPSLTTLLVWTWGRQDLPTSASINLLASSSIAVLSSTPSQHCLLLPLGITYTCIYEVKTH